MKQKQDKKLNNYHLKRLLPLSVFFSLLNSLSLKNEIEFLYFENVIEELKLQQKLVINMHNLYPESIILKETHRQSTNNDKKLSEKITAEMQQYA